MRAACECGADAVVQWRRRASDKGDTTVAVYACADHALSPEAAAYVHESWCAGPGKDGDCSCPAPTEPEFPFIAPDDPKRPRKRLPPGW
ncbi:hypothetical protein ACIQV3_22790 [Streptomyces sp. NPDC099050]|uniref:hypothetical protein n=1 Tax=Streptomyces sp. NPDC099050 TaxID=3366100 RepID=UPI0037F48CFD